MIDVNITTYRYVNDITQASMNKERYWLKFTLLAEFEFEKTQKSYIHVTTYAPLSNEY